MSGGRLKDFKKTQFTRRAIHLLKHRTIHLPKQAANCQRPHLLSDSILIFILFPLFAWPLTLHASPHFYLEGNVGYVSIPNQLHRNTNNASMQMALGGSINFGFMFNRYFGLETGGALLSNHYFYSGSLGGDTQKLSIKLPQYIANPNKYVNAAIKGVLPISNHLQVFAKMGTAYVSQKMTQYITTSGNTEPLGHREGAALLYGAGVAYQPLPDFALTVQNVFTQGTDHNAPSGTQLSKTMLLSLGVHFLFNS